MRKVSYTQMRAELSDILDALRNGEIVVVTQRGRPDTVLNGSLTNEMPSENSPPAFSRTHRTGYVVHTKDGQTVEVRMVKENGEVVGSRKLFKSTFRDALHKTQQKHAKIIKALEDK
ncbi:type II toxin-antitoxin system prevent-host-death family antitoxin [Enterobacter sp. WCHEn045836]|uniref:type II toxin-antitoxin system Phd/YefM family antitoxin n=1 Tax=Enterobacter sp. WCHEn045836 TaxID=2497434 RepID=UPI000F816B97|nr:type II toxin-antitoxin system prevent-host-death family antitoxin [Enterobacter sp. WCHEn045836]RTP97284.1 type II toxin-antitoxin system prevent-host-death family antitoxin [Enterobacter sp. WCHEn045836]